LHLWVSIRIYNQQHSNNKLDALPDSHNAFTQDTAWCTPMWDKMLPAPAPPLVFFVPKATYDDLVTSREESHNTHQPAKPAKTPRPWWSIRPPLQRHGVDGSTQSNVRTTRPWCWARSRTKNLCRKLLIIVDINLFLSASLVLAVHFPIRALGWRIIHLCHHGAPTMSFLSTCYHEGKRGDVIDEDISKALKMAATLLEYL
jgi:hypothetical protein